jgi:hypothetical protein
MARAACGLGAGLTLAAAGAVPASADVIGNVPVVRQQHALDCEAAALAMAMAHEGLARSQWQLLVAMGIGRRHPRGGLPGRRRPVPQLRRRPQRLGGPPDRLRRLPASGGAGRGGDRRPRPAGGGGIPAAAVYDQVAQGHPAVAWITYDWRPHARHDYVAWDGRWVPYAGPFEHTVTVVGVDGASVRVHDPARGAYWMARPTFEAAYGVYGGMAVVLA